MSCHVMWSCYISYIGYIYICLELATGHEMWPSFWKLELHFWVQPGLQIYQRAVGGKVCRDLSGSQLMSFRSNIFFQMWDSDLRTSSVWTFPTIVPLLFLYQHSNGRDGKNVAAVRHNTGLWIMQTPVGVLYSVERCLLYYLDNPWEGGDDSWLNKDYSSHIKQGKTLLSWLPIPHSGGFTSRLYRNGHRWQGAVNLELHSEDCIPNGKYHQKRAKKKP